MTSLAILAGLFASAFIAATIFPAQSEAALIAAALGTAEPWGLLIAVASLGNVLGSLTNWLLGRWIVHYRDRPWFPASPAMLAKAEGWYARFGVWSLLASFLPVIGDPLTVVAGMLRVPLAIFLLLVTISKVGRYAAILWALA